MNELKNIKRNLRNISKGNKYIKYSLGLAIAFMMSGNNAFGEEMTRQQIGKQVKLDIIKTDNFIKSMNVDGLDIETYNLLDQGKQVVKSWESSWQVGGNLFWWEDGINGKDNKSKHYSYQGEFTRSDDVLLRDISPNSEYYKDIAKSFIPKDATTTKRYALNQHHYNYGFATPKNIQEKPFNFEISVEIKQNLVKPIPIVKKEKTYNHIEPAKGPKFSSKNVEINPLNMPTLNPAPQFQIVFYPAPNNGSYGQVNSEAFETTSHPKTQNMPLYVNYLWSNGDYRVPKKSGSIAFKGFVDIAYGGIWTLGKTTPLYGNTARLDGKWVKKKYDYIKDWYFNSFNFKNEFTKKIQDCQNEEFKKLKINHQYFFVGGSRFMEQDDHGNSIAIIPQGNTVHLHGIYIAAMVNESDGQAQTINKGVITDITEKDDPYVINMPYDNGKDYLTIYDVSGKAQKIKRNKKGYLPFKTAITLVQEDNGSILKLENEGKIDLWGDKSIGIFVFVPQDTERPQILNTGTISINGESSYGIKSAIHATGTGEYLKNGGLIQLANDANNSIGIIVAKDDGMTNRDGVKFRKNAILNGYEDETTHKFEMGIIKLTDIENSIGVYTNIDTNITNNGKIIIDSTISKSQNPQEQKYNYGMRSDGETTSEVINNGTITLNGTYAIGLITDGAMITTSDKSQILTKDRDETDGNISHGIGIMAKDTKSVNHNGNIELIGSGDKVENIGVFLQSSTMTENQLNNNHTKVVGNGSIGIYTYNSTATYSGNIEADGKKVIGIFANNSVFNATNTDATHINNITIKDSNGTDNFSENSYGIVMQGDTSKYIGEYTDANISVSGNKGLGVYSQGEVKLHDIDIKAKDGAVALYLKDNGKISLNGGVASAGDKSIFLFKDGKQGTLTLNNKLTLNVSGKESVEGRGTAFYSTTGESIAEFFNNTFNNTQDNLTINMQTGSRLFILSNTSLNLTNATKEKIFEGITKKPIINGDDFVPFSLNESTLTIDQNVNLDNKKDTYNLLEIYGSSIINDSEMKGTKKVVALNQATTDGSNNLVNLINNNKIDLSGEKSIAILGKRANIENNGDITIGKNSLALFMQETDKGNAVGGKITNTKNITTDANSVGIYYVVEDGAKNISGGVENTTAGNITLNGDNNIGILANISNGLTQKTIKNSGTITIKGKNSTAIVGKGQGTYTLENTGTINLANSDDLQKDSNIGMYAKSSTISLLNSGKIQKGTNNTIAMMGKDITNSGTINLGDGSLGIYSENGNIINNGDILLGDNKSVAVSLKGTGSINTSGKMVFGAKSYGISATGDNNTISSTTLSVNLKNGSTYIYTSGANDTITNSTNINVVEDSKYAYGIYSAGNITNSGNMDFSRDMGGIAIYGHGTNSGEIKVGRSDAVNSVFGIGMVANGGDITNTGDIYVNNVSSIGMYGLGNMKVENSGNIIISANKGIGLYVSEGATAVNRGTIKTVGTPKKTIGVYLGKGSTLENHGTIEINGIGGFAVMNRTGNSATTVIKNYGTFKASKIGSNSKGTDSKEIGDLKLSYIPNKPVIITLAGKEKKPIIVSPETKDIDLPITASDIGMYIDTSGTRYTRPIEGSSNWKNVKDIIIGLEITKNTNSKYILIDDKKMLEPYNKVMREAIGVEKWNVYAGSLIWATVPELKDEDGTLKSVVLAKIPYTSWGSKWTKNFTIGLEERYSKANGREKKLFNKLNNIGNNEEVLLSQAIDEMLGHQYANVNQRIYENGKILDYEFDYLKNEWDTKTKNSNKVKVFGMRGEYNTKTAGVIDYKNHAQGFVYMHEYETVNLGDTVGVYGGIVHNEYSFKDIGKSYERDLQGRIGIYKAIPFDYNNSLNYTTSGELFLGRNYMKRRYLVVDEIFNARSKYWNYGATLNNTLTKTHRLSKNLWLDYFGGLRLEYGKIDTIKEKSGEMRLQVKKNHYIAITPKIGTSLKHRYDFDNSKLTTKLGFEYEWEVGKINKTQEVRVAYTNAPYYKIADEKNHRNRAKLNFSLGYDNDKYGINANIGWDFKNPNYGIGFRYIFDN